MKIETVAAQLEALGNTTRLTICRTLVRTGEGGLAVGKLQRKLDIAGSTLSHHIRKLVEVGLVSPERQATIPRCFAKACGGGPPPASIAHQSCNTAPGKYHPPSAGTQFGAL